MVVSVAVDRRGVWTVVVAGGRGARFGGHKQLEPLGGETVLGRAVREAAGASEGVVVVVPAELVGRGVGALPATATVVAGGPTRAASVRAGLAGVPDGAEVVLVHDAARPLATAALFARVVAGVRAGAEAVVPVVPVHDTIRAVGGGVVDRDGLRAVQTPQGFAAPALRAAHAAGADATDDATLVEATGARVVLVDGEPENLKITRPTDLVVARALVAAGSDTAGEEA